MKALHCKFMTTCLTVHFVKSGIVYDILEMHMRQKVFQQNIDTWHVVIWPRIHCQSLEIPCSATKSNLFGFLRSNGHLDPVRQKGTKSQDRRRNYQRVHEKLEFFRYFCRKSLLSKLSKMVFKRLIVVFNPCEQFFTLMAKPFFSTYSLSSILVSLFVDYTYAGKNEFKICFLKEK